jgi:hypothetical protein
VARYSFFASFVATFFLALALITYIPSHSILIITFVLAGLFVGELVRTHGGKHKMIEYKEKKGHRIGFTVILSLVILVSVVWVIMNIKQTAAQFYFGKSVAALNTSGSVDEASMLIKKALSLNATDVYYQAQAQIDMYAANQIISSASTTPDQTTVAKVGTLVSDSLTAARSAETFDPTNVYNFITEARVSELATTLAIPNAYENGKAAYLKAIQLSPLNPAVYLAYAKLEFYKGNTNVASDALSAALQLKPDYTDALFEAALMAYSAKSYDTAKSALDALIKIDPKYPNIDALGTAISAKISNPGTGVSAPSEPQVPASKQIKPVPAKH